MEQQDRLIVASIQQSLPSVLHQKGVSIMDGIPQLESEDGIRSQTEEFPLQFGRRQPVLI